MHIIIIGIENITKLVNGKYNMKKEKTKKTIEQENEEFLKTVDNGKIYEGLVCLDIKLSKLIEIMDGIGNYLENKKNGTLGIS